MDRPTVVSAVGRRRGCRQNLLIEREVQPASELETCLRNGAAMRESQPLVQPDAHGIRGIDAAYHHVVILADRGVDDGFEQLTSQTAAAEPGVDVDGMLDSVFVCGPGAKRAVTAEAHER